MDINITKSKELIVVNIPAYLLLETERPELQSKVVVGKTLNKTVIFSAPMKYIVF
jgi:murein L,D-transpeptidase YcbB/YkuD